MPKKTSVEDIILSRLDKIEEKMDAGFSAVHAKLEKHGEDIADVKAKSSLWGGISGAASGIVTGFVLLFTARGH